MGELFPKDRDTGSLWCMHYFTLTPREFFRSLKWPGTISEKIGDGPQYSLITNATPLQSPDGRMQLIASRSKSTKSFAIPTVYTLKEKPRPAFGVIFRHFIDLHP